MTRARPGLRSVQIMSGNSVALLARQARAIDGPLPCRREDPRLWFSDSPADLDMARAHCRPCPLRGPCLAGAIERREPSGVWGGEIFARGAIIERKRPRGRPRRQLLRRIRFLRPRPAWPRACLDQRVDRGGQPRIPQYRLQTPDDPGLARTGSAVQHDHLSLHQVTVEATATALEAIFGRTSPQPGHGRHLGARERGGRFHPMGTFG